MQSFDELRKQSAAKAYESPQFNEALGEVLHPGGLKLTARVAEVAQINSRSHVLDIASGRGTTAFFLAQQYGCQVLGIDLSMTSTSLAMAKAEAQGLQSKVIFAAADAERLPFHTSTFDVVISECSFSLLPDKEAGAREIARVLKPGGRLAITDVFLRGQLSDELRTNATFDSCFSGAETIDSYIEIFTNAGFIDPYTEDQSMV